MSDKQERVEKATEIQDLEVGGETFQHLTPEQAEQVKGGALADTAVKETKIIRVNTIPGVP